MSVTTETDSHHYPINVITRMYANCIAEDVSLHANPDPERFNNPYFAASLQFARTLHAHHGMKPQELAETPEMQAVEENIYALPADNRNHAKFYKQTLLQAAALVTGKCIENPDALRTFVYRSTVDRTESLRNMLRNPHVDARQVGYLKHLLGGSSALATINRRGLAIPALPHHAIDSRPHPHAGILIDSFEHTLIAGAHRFDVGHKCGGFAVGHAEIDAGHMQSTRLRRVNLLSTCCDLRLIRDNGREDTDLLVDMLSRDVRGVTTPDEKAKLDELGDTLIGSLIHEASVRKGTKLTPAQWRQRSPATSRKRKQRNAVAHTN
ncbi:MAG TPA: hypothetical protein VGE30_03830 [Candidatus Saccharimonadales bacterium]